MNLFGHTKNWVQIIGKLRRNPIIILELLNIYVTYQNLRLNMN